MNCTSGFIFLYTYRKNPRNVPVWEKIRESFSASLRLTMPLEVSLWNLDVFFLTLGKTITKIPFKTSLSSVSNSNNFPLITPSRLPVSSSITAGTNKTAFLRYRQTDRADKLSVMWMTLILISSALSFYKNRMVGENAAHIHFYSYSHHNC